MLKLPGIPLAILLLAMSLTLSGNGHVTVPAEISVSQDESLWRCSGQCCPHIEEGIPGYFPLPGTKSSREAFRDAGFGIFIHWGIYSMLADGECIMHEKGIHFNDYSRLAGGFCPSRFDASAWVSAVKSSGARYITITAKHIDGFSMFASRVSEYNVADATPFGRDVIGELASECHKQGIALNFYYSLADLGREDYPVGVLGRACGKDPSKADFDHYMDYVCEQVNELLTCYGPVGCIWFDCDWDHIAKPAPGGKVKVDFDWQYCRLYGLVHSLQPSCLIGNNHHRESIPGEDIQIFERDVPGENTSGFSRTAFINNELPLETCQTMNGSWGYSITDNDYKSPDELIRCLVRASGRNANLLLNVGPQPDGCFPPEAVGRLYAIGSWLKVYGDTVYGTRATLLKPQVWGVVTHKDDRVFLHVLEKPVDGKIVLPLDIHASAVVEFGTGKELSYHREDGRFVVIVPEDADCSIDYIIEIVKKQKF